MRQILKRGSRFGKNNAPYYQARLFHGIRHVRLHGGPFLERDFQDCTATAGL